MEIFLVSLTLFSLVTVGYGNPVGSQWKVLQEDRNPTFQQITQNVEGFQSTSFNEPYEVSRSDRQLNMDGYSRFGKDVLSSHDDNLARDYKTDERQNLRNENSGTRGIFSNRNEVRGISPSAPNVRPQIQTSFHQDNQRRSSRFEYSPVSQAQTKLSGEESHGSDAVGKAFVMDPRGQEYVQRDVPFSLDRRSENPAKDQQNIFDRRSPSIYDQRSLEGAAFRGQNDFRSADVHNDRSLGRFAFKGQSDSRSPSVHNQESLHESTFQNRDDFISPSIHGQRSLEGSAFQNQKDFRSAAEKQQFQTHPQPLHQNEARKDRTITDNSQYFTQIPQFTNSPSFQVSQEQVSQRQNFTQHPFPSVPEAGSFATRQATFDSRRMSSPTATGKISQRTSANHKKCVSTSNTGAKFGNPAWEDVDMQNRRIGNNEGIQMPTGIGFEGEGGSHEKYPTENPQEDTSEVDYQRLFQNIREQQPILTATQLKHQAQTTISGAKSESIRPHILIMHRPENVPPPHAVVLGKDSSISGKASVLQHLQTPYVQYTYNHPL